MPQTRARCLDRHDVAARATRSPGVDDQAPDPMVAVLSPQPVEPEPDLGGAWMAVVQRDRLLAAPERRGKLSLAAMPPEGMGGVAPWVGLLAAVRGVDQAVDGVRSAGWEAEEASGREPAGRVDENDDLTAAVLAVEGVGHVSRAAAGVAPEGAARLGQLLQPEPVGVAGSE